MADENEKKIDDKNTPVVIVVIPEEDARLRKNAVREAIMEMTKGWKKIERIYDQPPSSQ